MSVNIVDLVKSNFSQDLISKAGSFLNESEGGISKAVSGIVPTLLGSITSKAASSEQEAGSILDTAKGFFNSGIQGNLGSLFGNADILSKGTTIFQGLFGGSSNSIIDAISGFAGIKSSSTGSLLSMITPFILSLLGKHASENNLSASGFSSFLNDQKNNIASALPSGLSSIGSLLGLGGLANLAGNIKDGTAHVADKVKDTAGAAVDYTEQAVQKAGGGAKWLLPLILLAVVALALWYFLSKGCNGATGTGSENDTSAMVSQDTTATPPVETTTVTRTLTQITLPNGEALQAYPGGIEDQLIQFIQSDEYKNATNDQLKEKWFNFDDLNFEFGTAKLTDSSKRQLDNITAILKAFPDVKIKVGAYTDKVGDDNVNLKLSDERAKAVQAALKAAGVAAQIPEAEGYGEQFATVDESASDEQRAADRKTAVRLIK